MQAFDCWTASKYMEGQTILCFMDFFMSSSLCVKCLFHVALHKRRGNIFCIELWMTCQDEARVDAGSYQLIFFLRGGIYFESANKIVQFRIVKGSGFFGKGSPS
jgi:hypothetical protein